MKRSKTQSSVTFAALLTASAWLPADELPFLEGTEVIVTQGYEGSESHYTVPDKYALDLVPVASPIDGVPVLACSAGTVIRAEWSGSTQYGWRVAIRDSIGDEIHYGHLSAIFVAPGDSVDLGQHVGAMGDTGHSTNPHLHLVKRNAAGISILPEPIGGYSGIREGDRLVSRNQAQAIVSVGLDDANTALAYASKAVCDRFMETQYDLDARTQLTAGVEKFGLPSDDGSGEYLHEWKTSDSREWRWYGYTIQNFDGGSLGSCAIVFNPSVQKAFAIHGGFWNVFRYGVGDGSGFGPTISVGGGRLGFPLSDEFQSGSKTLQRFEGGSLEWDPARGNVNVLGPDGRYLYTTSPDGPKNLRLTGRGLTTLQIAFEPTPGASVYKVFLNGIQAMTRYPEASGSSVSIASDGPTAVASSEEHLELDGLAPGSAQRIQIIAVDGSDRSLSRSQLLSTTTASSTLKFVADSGNRIHRMGADAYLWAIASGPREDVQYTWSRGGQVVGNHPELTISPVDLSSTGQYTVSARDSDGTVISKDLFVLVDEAAYDDWLQANYNGEAFRASSPPMTAAGTAFFGSGASNFDAFLGSARTPLIDRGKTALRAEAGEGFLRLMARRPRGYLSTTAALEMSEDLRTWMPVSPDRVRNVVTAHFSDGLSTEQRFEIDTLGAARLFVRERFLEQAALQTVFSETFDDPSRLGNLFETSGDLVEISSGYLRIVTATTDHGGQAATRLTVPGWKRLRIVTRKFMTRGNSAVFMPAVRLCYFDGAGNVQAAWGVFYADVNYDDSQYRSAFGTYIMRGNGNPHIRADESKVVARLPVTFGSYFTEVIDWDPARATIRYGIGTQRPISFRMPMISKAQRVFLLFDAWGWFTGHKVLLNDLAIYAAP